jgi:hypothetical protein
MFCLDSLTIVASGNILGYLHFHTAPPKCFLQVLIHLFDTRCRRFDPGGSLDRRVNLSLRVPAQMGWREMEHKGGKRGSCYPVPGDALVVGLQALARERE